MIAPQAKPTPPQSERCLREQLAEEWGVGSGEWDGTWGSAIIRSAGQREVLLLETEPGETLGRAGMEHSRGTG